MGAGRSVVRNWMGFLPPVRWDGLSSPELWAVDPTLPDSLLGWVDVTADGGRIAGFCFNVDNPR